MQTEKKRATQNTTHTTQPLSLSSLRGISVAKEQNPLDVWSSASHRLFPSSPFALKDHLRGVTTATMPTGFT